MEKYPDVTKKMQRMHKDDPKMWNGMQRHTGSLVGK
jgi:hypothetical protein